MNQDRNKRAARRLALLQALRLGVGAAVLTTRARAESAAPAKLSKDSVEYTDAGEVEGKDCDDCSLFIPGNSPADAGTCKIVAGPIAPHGHCIAFSPMRKQGAGT